MKTHLIAHIFNEEYLLPYWLNYHSKLFDNIIIIDYNSTDNSLNICRTICPNIVIIPSRNSDFNAVEVDREVMDIENTLDGIKMALNVTEFLICKTNISTVFEKYNDRVSLSVEAITAYSRRTHIITDLITDLLEPDMVFKSERGNRQIHTYPNGAYHVGRHQTSNPQTNTTDFYIAHLGNYPMNESVLKRKQQIGQRIPECDRIARYGFHHLFTKEQIIQVTEESISVGKPLKDVSPGLFDIITENIQKP